MKRKILVSVIIPTRNRAKLLKRSVASVLNQSYRNIEVIVIDDASEDETFAFLKSIKDKRLKFIRLEEQRGQSIARNIGIKKAKGELIAFNDDDDIWKRKKLDYQVSSSAATDKKIGIIYTKIKRTEGKRVWFLPSGMVSSRQKKVQGNLFLENFIGLPSALIKRECFKKLGLFDKKLLCYEDWDLWLRFCKHYGFKYVPKVLVESPILPEGVTSNKNILLRATEIIFKKHKKEISKDKRILASWFFRLGDLYYHKRSYRKARNYFKKAVKVNSLKKYKRAIVKTYIKKDMSEFLIKLKTKTLKNKAILLVLLFGFVLRAVGINQSFWLDEVVQAMTSAGTFKGLFLELTGDFHPPFYHIFMWFWVRIFENKEIAMRLPSLILGSLTIVVVYKIALFIREEIKTKSLKLFPIIASLFMATGPFHIYYSQEARNYAMTCFLSSLSTLFFLPIFKSQKQNKKETIKYFVATIVLLYTNYFAIFVVLAQNIAMLLKHRSLKKIKNWIVLQILLLVSFSPVFLLLSKQLMLGKGATQALPEWGRLVNTSALKALPLTFAKFSIGRITIFNKKLYALLIGFLFLVDSIIFLKVFQKEKNRFFQKSISIIFIWFLVPLGLAFLTSFFIPNFQPFRLLLVLPASYLLLGFGIFSFKKELRIVLVSLILIVNLVSAFAYFTNPFFKREDWRGLTNYLDKQDNAVVVFPSNTSDWPYRFYSNGQNDLLSLSQGFSQVTEESSKNLLSNLEENEIYYIRYLVPMFDMQENFLKALEKNNFRKEKEISFNQISVWRFKRN